MRHGYERSVIRGNPENDVCRGEVGEQLPVARETVEPFDIIVGQAALGMDEITEGGHPTSLMARVELLRAPRTMWHAIGGRGPQVGSPRLLYARACNDHDGLNNAVGGQSLSNRENLEHGSDRRDTSRASRSGREVRPHPQLLNASSLNQRAS